MKNRSEADYRRMIEHFVKSNYGTAELREPSWDIDALAKTLASARIHRADNKDHLQLQHELGHPVPKTIHYTQGGWDFIEAYGAIMGMTLEQAANFMLIGAVTGMLKEDAFNKMVVSYATAKKMKRERERKKKK